MWYQGVLCGIKGPGVASGGSRLVSVGNVRPHVVSRGPVEKPKALHLQQYARRYIVFNTWLNLQTHIYILRCTEYGKSPWCMYHRTVLLLYLAKSSAALLLEPPLPPLAIMLAASSSNRRTNSPNTIRLGYAAREIRMACALGIVWNRASLGWIVYMYIAALRYHQHKNASFHLPATHPYIHTSINP